MNREIKFRRWDTDEKYMYYDKPFYLNTNKSRYQIMQFTGLKDKNGKEIYEGDIVCYQNEKCKGDVKFGIYEYYEYEECDFGNGFYIDRVDSHKEGLLKNGDVEIIGNIYENKELLTNK